jgi:glycosyltransferase involved in cell wall biosynthesis
MPRLFIHATNVHQGGGKSLLTALLDSLPVDLKVVGLLDSRMVLQGDIAEKLEIRFTSPSVWQRLKAEWWLTQNVQPQDTVLCFGNLPPLFKLQGHVTAFVQNRYLVEKVSLGNFPIKTRLRLSLERLWLLTRAANVDEFLVQTSSMKAALLSSGCIVKQPVHIRPFASMLDGSERAVNPKNNSQEHKRYDFVYVASGDPHKNHRRLVKAWCLLAEQGLFPSLCLTLDEHVSAELCVWINEQKLQYGLNLENVGFLSHDQIVQLYTQAQALIYPSQFESFGLPLIEARQAGLQVLASELDYVRDVQDPEQSFDPNSPLSIARAVRRYLGVSEFPMQLLDAAKFVEVLLKRHG